MGDLLEEEPSLEVTPVTLLPVLALAGASLENGVSKAEPLNPMGGSGEALLDAPAHETINVPDVA